MDLQISFTMGDGKEDLTEKLRGELAKKLQIFQSAPTSSAAKDLAEAKQHKYQFWETQPMPKFGTN